MGEISLHDPFGHAIKTVISEKGFQSVLEIGAWDGTGSTICIINGMRSVPDPKKLICLEIDKKRYDMLVKNTKDFNFVHPVCTSSVSSRNFLVKDFDIDVWKSKYNKIKSGTSRDEVYSWYQNFLAKLAESDEGFLDGNKDFFDAVLIDGCSFTGYSEYCLLKNKTNCFMLDDSHHSFKCTQVYDELKNDTNWILSHDFADLRNGASIFLRRGETIDLFVSWYKEDSEQRTDELYQCLLKNIENCHIRNIYLVVDKKDYPSIPFSIKIKMLFVGKRPTFNDFFSLMRSSDATIKIVSNSDIFFDDTLKHARNLKGGECYALTRWDVTDNDVKFLNRSWSQDAWFFRDIPDKVDGNFEQGRLGCDGRIAYELNKSGYVVKNPSKTIKIFHLHNHRKAGGVGGHDTTLAIAEPKLAIDPIDLGM